MLCRKCAGEGRLNYNPTQYPQDIHACDRCLGTGIEPEIAYEDYIAMTEEAERLKAEIERLSEDRDLWKESEAKANAYSKELLAEIERKDAEQTQAIIDAYDDAIKRAKIQMCGCRPYGVPVGLFAAMVDYFENKIAALDQSMEDK